MWCGVTLRGTHDESYLPYYRTLCPCCTLLMVYTLRSTKLSNAFILSLGRNSRYIPPATLSFHFKFLLRFFFFLFTFSFLIAHKHSISISFAEIFKYSQGCSHSWCVPSFPLPLIYDMQVTICCLKLLCCQHKLLEVC